ncbi:MAG: GntR family transcriptional regulator [Anaerolineae bacterium]|nr:GntR family transcriptional regulator [Anaerolineae bacterium]
MPSQTRVQSVTDSLRDSIRQGRLQGRERLVELSLAEQYGVSQNTIREALARLETEGWVVKTARHGVRIRSFSLDEADEVYTLWLAVAGVALRWLVSHPNKSSFARLKKLIETARRQALQNQAEDAFETLLEWHRSLGIFSGRAQTAELLGNLVNRVAMLERLRANRSPRSLHALQAQILLYSKLVSLLENGDGAGAADLLQYLILDDLETLLPVLDVN